MVLLHLELGRDAEAREAFATLASDQFAVLETAMPWIGRAALLAEACAALGDGEHAAILYERMRSAATHHVTFGPTLYCGPVARYLGLLAACLSRWDTAEEHFGVAVASATRIGARPSVDHIQNDLAAILVARGRVEDRAWVQTLLTAVLETARELGMTRLLERALATRLRAQGAESSDPSSSIDAVAAAVERERPDLGAHSSPSGALTIAFSDSEGFTALTERLGEGRAHAILRAHKAIVREQVAEHGGLVIRSQGDDFMFAFPDARRGIGCAITIRWALADHGARDQEEAYRARIGLHTGRVIEESDDLHGRNVILAARIADQAHGARSSSRRR